MVYIPHGSGQDKGPTIINECALNLTYTLQYFITRTARQMRPFTIITVLVVYDITGGVAHNLYIPILKKQIKYL